MKSEAEAAAAGGGEEGRRARGACRFQRANAHLLGGLLYKACARRHATFGDSGVTVFIMSAEFLALDSSSSDSESEDNSKVAKLKRRKMSKIKLANIMAKLKSSEMSKMNVANLLINSESEQEQEQAMARPPFYAQFFCSEPDEYAEDERDERQVGVEGSVGLVHGGEGVEERLTGYEQGGGRKRKRRRVGAEAVSEAGKESASAGHWGHQDVFQKLLLRLYDGAVQEKKACKELPLRFESVCSAQSMFQDLILQESLAVLKHVVHQVRRSPGKALEFQSTGIEHSDVKIETVQLELIRVASKRCEYHFRVMEGFEMIARRNSCTIFVLKLRGRLHVGIESIKSKRDDTEHVCLILMNLGSDENLLKEGTVFKASYGPNLLPLERIFSSKVLPQKLPYEHILLRGTNGSHVFFDQDEADDVQVERHEQKDCAHILNQAQLGAVSAALAKLDSRESVVLWQGPPGTGKTTTMCYLLQILAEKVAWSAGEKVVISGPSNKSVQVVLERLLLLLGHECVSQYQITLVSSDAALNVERLERFDSRFALDSAFERLCQGLESHLPDALAEFGDFLSNRMPCIWSALFEKRKDGPAPASLLLARASTSDGFARSWASEQSRALPDSLRQKAANEFVATARFVFATQSVCGRASMVQALESKVRYLVIDEASQSTEAETWVALQTKPKNLLLVGDPMQLPATVLSKTAADAGFQRSLMKRLMDCGYEYSFLRTQYRMHPDICEFPNRAFYDERLENAPAVLQTSKVVVEMPRLAFYDVSEGRDERGTSNKSYRNREEAAQIASLLSRLERANAGLDLATSLIVITFYSQQVREIERAIARLKIKRRPKVATVDSFQGSEADIVVLSFCRSNVGNHVGFLNCNNRLNVALTRAKRCLILFGAAKTLAQSESRTLGELVDFLKAKGKMMGTNTV